MEIALAEIALEEIAQAAGYVKVQRVETKTDLRSAAAKFLSQAGPSFLLIKIEPDQEERHEHRRLLFGTKFRFATRGRRRVGVRVAMRVRHGSDRVGSYRG